MADLGTVAGDACSVALSINSQGQIVGFGAADCNHEDHGFLSENGGPIIDLGTLVLPGSDLRLIEAVFINDRGEIVGRGKLANDDEHALVLLPCDENHPDIEGCDYSLVEETAIATTPATTEEPVPATTAQQKLTPSEMQAKAIAASKVRPFVLYSLRHTFLTRLGESGCDTWTLARIAGHSSIAISSRYVHPSHDSVLAAVERLGGHRIGHSENHPLLTQGATNALPS